MAEETAPIEHMLVPKHQILEEKEADAFLSRYNISKQQMPRIKKNDDAIKILNAKPGDIIRITRKSPLGGTAPFYRVVMED